MNSKIAIIGGGASSIAFIDAFIEKQTSNSPSPINITVFEKSKDLGPGNAYQGDAESNLLNTKAGYITIFKDKPGDFFQWLTLYRYRWQPLYPNLQVAENSYAPRPLFGMYMANAFDRIVKKAFMKNIIVKVIRSEVIQLTENSDPLPIKLKTLCQQSFKFNSVIVACGTLSKSPFSPPINSQIHHTPYPISTLRRNIEKSDSVAIIGARLSAIDAVIGLIENGHHGKITLFSRSHLFPFVRGTQGRYKNTYLSAEFITQHYTSLTLSQLSQLFIKEMCHYQQMHPQECSEDIVFPPTPIKDLSKFLSSEMVKANQNRGWQAILYDTNSILALVWEMLKDADKARFMTTMMSAAMSMRVSIPYENASKIKSYIDNGQLEYIGGDTQIETCAKNTLSVKYQGGVSHVDSIVYAVGSPRDIYLSDSELIRNMVDTNIAKAHKFGGIDVCNTSYALLNKKGKRSASIYAIGEVTHGCFLFTSALDIIVKHAHNCAKSVHHDLNTYTQHALAV
ncbi:FAD/NAD(P)-binding protein [Pseudoalteromonas sp. MMG012]|uniref:FAD/NAD(P)-binding protein n=1 Tax=Pseudoalteromonas sp. MMG012 TaxID=2822686 RepID=UPI001B3A7074|nr:FAD/NAD(P)-binding protein [Pseudoalteromonas sp. MMG012]MBQ4852394.1 FAD/NAD(P)-binding protein [Pseudoalteromonas sp. MMG012]